MSQPRHCSYVRRVQPSVKTLPLTLTCYWDMKRCHKKCRCQDDPNGSFSREIEETTRASPHHTAVSEYLPARSESLQPHTQWSSLPGSEPPSVEADVYVWCYTLLVVHARTEEEDKNIMITATRRFLKHTNIKIERRTIMIITHVSLLSLELNIKWYDWYITGIFALERDNTEEFADMFLQQKPLSRLIIQRPLILKHLQHVLMSATYKNTCFKLCTQLTAFFRGQPG